MVLIKQEQLGVFGKRIFADALDLLIASPIIVITALTTKIENHNSPNYLIGAFLGYIGYLIISVLLLGITPGKRLLNLKILELVDYKPSMGKISIEYKNKAGNISYADLQPGKTAGKFIYLTNIEEIEGSCKASYEIRWLAQSPSPIILAAREVVKVIVMIIPIGFMVYLAGIADSRKQTLYDRACGIIIVEAEER